MEIFSEFGLTGCKPANSPANASIRLNSNEGNLLEDATSFRRLIGRLLYLTNTRSDIAFAIQQVSQFVSKPRNPHLHDALRILRYLKGSPGLGLFYSIDNDLKIQAFSVSDWATCPVSRKLGYCIFLGKSLISWKAKKQTTISRNSTKVEYRALASLACELQWLKYLWDDLHLPIPVPFCTFSNSESAIQLAKNPSFHEN
ncbi:uncharacterized mitochondrial protein AtMg00810-like [Glycine max]|uniref:uncharacterized mitochondrial protein AtMg00810-like n=1 Tax=Glycine max TaxID=3847 RepID=UPI0003DE827B|nr:uncharacterized mitochondrial protein AtMg00810-like [Glycine max]|eukprot:XP_006593176.1 uncharacterized protein LOC102670337 [Glycine max]